MQNARLAAAAAGNLPLVPDPVEKVEELAEEAAEGKSERTPWLVMGGVHISVALIALAVMGVVGLIYFLSQ